MKKSVVLFLLFSFVAVNAQDKQVVISSFQKVVNKVDQVFKGVPVILTSQSYKSSTSGKIYYKLQLEGIEINYDIQTSTSLVSPYTGYIILKVKVKTTAKSGDVMGYKEKVGFSDSISAVQNNNFESCADASYDFNKWCVGEIKINYAYQNNKWVFKNIETETENKIGMGTVRGDIERGILDNLFKN